MFNYNYFNYLLYVIVNYHLKVNVHAIINLKFWLGTFLLSMLNPVVL